MLRGYCVGKRLRKASAAVVLFAAIGTPSVRGQAVIPLNKPKPRPAVNRPAAQPAATTAAPARLKLVVMIVVDQMRGDYVDKFHGQWTGGLKRLVEEGAWFHDAAYPYAATETCVGHATISTGALPATHGMVANAW